MNERPDPSPPSATEQHRLKVLAAYQILDTPPEQTYDDVVHLAAHICQTPIAIISLVDDQRQWFKAALGITLKASDRAHAFCTFTIASDQPFIVEDAQQDPRFAQNPFVLGEPHIRFYAGIPLVSALGATLGSLAVIDRVPRHLTDNQLAMLQALGRQVMGQLDLRLERNSHTLTSLQLSAAQQVGQMGSWQLDLDENCLTWTDEVYRIFGTDPQSFGATFEAFFAFVHPDDRPAMIAAQKRTLTTNHPLDITHRIIRPDGDVRYVRERAKVMPATPHASPLLVGTVQDITEERQQQERQREQERQLRYALDTLSFHLNNSPLAVVEWDHDFCVSRWSDRATLLFGWTEAEVLGLHPSEWPFVAPEDAEAVNNIMAELLSQGVSHNTSLNRNLTKEGDTIYCEWYNSIRVDDTGNLISIFSLVQNVSDRIQASQEISLRSQELYKLNIQLQTSEERFRRMFAAASMGIVAIGPGDRLLNTNTAFSQMIGYSAGQLLHRNFLTLIDPRDRPLYETQLAQLRQGQQDHIAMELRFICKENQPVWSRISVAAERDAQGQTQHLVAVTEDISQTHLMAEKLRQSQALARLGGRIGRIGGWAADLTKNQVYWSEEIFAILEWSVINPPPLDQSLNLYPPEDREALQTAMIACAETGTPFDLELDLMTPNNQPLRVRVVGEPERDETGKIVRVIGAFQDISAQKQAELAQEQLATRLQNTLESMTDAFYLLDDEWRFSYLNAEAENVLHRTAKELIGQVVWEAFPGSTESELFREYHLAIAENCSRHFEFYYPPLEEWFEVNAYPSSEGLSVYFRVISQRIALEEQLRQSQRLESLGQLTGGVAHDFNNLLTVILGNAELINDQLGSESPLLPLAEMIADAAQRGAELTSRLLSFARRQTLAPTPLNINQLIAGIEPLIQRTIGEHIQIQFALSRHLWIVSIDPSQLESTLLNLCINSRDAMPQGGYLTIETTNIQLDEAYTDQSIDLEPGEYVLIAVSDTGTGIPAESLQRVFEPFFTTKGKGKGTGLGLSMVYGFIKQSRGHIKIYSELGEGTTVKMYLPRYYGDDERTSVTPKPEQKYLEGQELILLVEDDELVRAYAYQQLQSLGYRVVQAANGAEALEMIQWRNDIDLLFTDVVMPQGMNGRELAEAAQALRPHLKVLYTSGYSENAITHHGRLDPGVLLLSKPYRRTELAQKIREVLDVDGSG